jgi:RNA polymerase sigma-70 factor (ECF subfamily)
MPSPHTQPDDKQLVARLKQRDRSALDDLVQWHGARMYGVAMQFMRHEADAQEAVQDALVAVWKRIDSFEGRSAFSSWLYRVTANAALMALRKRKKHDRNISMDAMDDEARGQALGLSHPGDRPDAAALRGEVGDRVRAAIDQLAEPYRTAVLLRDVEEFSIAEIAELTDASEPAVKSRLHRGRLALRKQLLPWLQGQAGEARSS